MTAGELKELVKDIQPGQGYQVECSSHGQKFTISIFRPATGNPNILLNVYPDPNEKQLAEISEVFSSVLEADASEIPDHQARAILGMGAN